MPGLARTAYQHPEPSQPQQESGCGADKQSNAHLSQAGLATLFIYQLQAPGSHPQGLSTAEEESVKRQPFDEQQSLHPDARFGFAVRTGNQNEQGCHPDCNDEQAVIDQGRQPSPQTGRISGNGCGR